MATKSTGGRKSAGAAADVLGQLAAIAPTTDKPKSGKPAKWEMSLTAEALVEARRWVEAKAVIEPVEKRLENSKNELMEHALDVMADKLFANKSKPSNPIVVIRQNDGKGAADHQFGIQMTDKFKFRFPEVPENADARDHFIEVFKSLGLRHVDAENLVDNELDFNPITGFKTLSELLEGRYGEGREWIDSSDDEKSAGRKFAALLLWNGDLRQPPVALTPEEKAMVVQRSAGMQVRAGFYDRVATYCQSKDQLLGIFKVIQPVIYPAYVRFAMNDSETNRTSRKIEAAADILGTATVSED